MSRPTMIDIYMLFASDIATRSTCQRAQQGTIIVSHDLYHIYSIGYNGSLRGGEHNCNEQLGPGLCGCIHSETNAILKVTALDNKKIMFSTSSPCGNCAKNIIQSGFSAVYYAKEYRDKTPIELLTSYNIACILYK